MAFRRPGAPSLTHRISTVSPSFAAQIEICPLAAIFARDEAFRPLAARGSHFAALGEICHSLWEREGRGDFSGLEGAELAARLNAAWDEAEKAALDELRTSLGGIEPPPASRWPGYMAKRLGILGLIRRAVATRGAHASAADRAGDPASVEKAISAPDVPLHGRPDRIIWTGNKPQVIDLKTCATGDAMKPKHRRQLLAYAFLVHASSGLWPQTATIQYVDGSERSFEVDPCEAKRVVAEMTAALETVNQHGAAAESAARPSEEACRWCSFRVACAPFFRSVGPSWNFSDRNVLGTVEEVELDASRPYMALAAEMGNVDEDRIVVVASDPKLLEGVTVGDIVSVAGCQSTRSPTTIECGWDALICMWDEMPLRADQTRSAHYRGAERN